MNFVINPIFIDIITVVIILLMIIFGYIKGFVYSAYRLASTIVSLIVALYLSSYLAVIFKLYEVQGIGQSIGEMINRFLIFVILLIVLKVIFALIGKIIIPLLKGVIDRIGLLRKLDGFLGAIFNLVESLILIYLALVFIITPIVPGGKEAVENTIIADKILELVPSLSEEVKKISAGNNIIDQIINDGLNNDSFDSDSMCSIITSLSMAYDWGLIDQEYLADILYRYYDQVQTPIAVNGEQYNQTLALLNKLKMVEFDQNRVLNKMVVSG